MIPLTERPYTLMSRTRARAVRRSRGNITVTDLYRLADYQGDVCAVPWCDDLATDLDHIVSVKFGGTSNRANLQFLCERHNSIKGSMPWPVALRVIAHMEQVPADVWTPA